MRTLRFIVDNQIIRQDPYCDFDNLTPGSEEHIKAEFVFTKDWDGFDKVVAFYNNLGRELGAKALIGSRSCYIPSAALKQSVFKIQVIGAKNDVKLRTNKVEVHQKGGNV